MATLESKHVDGSRDWYTTIVNDDGTRTPCGRRATRREAEKVACWFAGKNGIEIEGIIEKPTGGEG